MRREREILGDDRCLLTKGPKLLELMDSEDFFLFGERTVAYFLLAIPDIVERMPKKIWQFRKDRMGEPLYTYPLVVYYRREKPRMGYE